jgi:RND superfamily putative drug exporter
VTDHPKQPRPHRPWGTLVAPAVWLAIGVVAAVFVPPLKEAVPEARGGFLPADADVNVAGRLFAEQFGETERSSAAIVARRRGGLTDADRAYLGRLTDALHERLRTRESRPYGQDWPSGLRSPVAGAKSPPVDPLLRNKLLSRDGHAAVIQVQMPFEMITAHTVPQVTELEKLIAALEPPAGLETHLTGSASLGRDYIIASHGGMERTLNYTIAGVVLVLLLVYRSPLAVVAALLVVSTAVFLSFRVASVMAYLKLPVSQMAEQFMVVLLYGAGTDFCLFLFARYREEIAGFEQAHGRAERRHLPAIMAVALTRTRPAILASAATVVIAMATMVFARFEAYRTAGPALAGGLTVVTIASLTLAPALMLSAGRALFWPGRGVSSGGTFGGLWERMGAIPAKVPVVTVIAVLAAFAPFWVVSTKTTRVFDTLQELPEDSPGARGAAAFREHFPAGEAYPISLIVRAREPVIADGARAPNVETGAAVDRVAAAIRRLDTVHDVRGLYQPYGALGGPGSADAGGNGPLALLGNLVRDRIAEQSARVYLGKDRRSLRFDVILKAPAYNNESLDTAADLQGVVAAAAAGTPLAGAEVHAVGNTPTMRDIRSVTRADLFRVAGMVAVCLLLILLWLLGDLMLSIVLLGATAAGYFATLGLTAVVWEWVVGRPGLDWKLDFFLFCILAAVGQDYNIFIVSRIMEERKKGQQQPAAASATGKAESAADGQAPVNDSVTAGDDPAAAAVRAAVARTGGIISCCGVVMAVTFGSMLAAPLIVMRQIGFALAAGVLIDTFILRPLMVPAAYVILERLKSRRKGRPTRPAGD